MEDILNISTLSITEKPDRLSSLPEHLLSEILSKLPTDSAVATSILSRHWHHQWTYITRFHLNPRNITNCDQLLAFLTTVDNILRQLNSPPTNLRTFDLNFMVPYPDDPSEDDIGYELCCEFLPRWFHRLCTSHTQRLQVGAGSDTGGNENAAASKGTAGVQEPEATFLQHAMYLDETTGIISQKGRYGGAARGE